MKRVVPDAVAKEAYRFTSAAYAESGAAESFRIPYDADYS
jgi:hypothetical protein